MEELVVLVASGRFAVYAFLRTCRNWKESYLPYYKTFICVFRLFFRLICQTLPSQTIKLLFCDPQKYVGFKDLPGKLCMVVDEMDADFAHLT